MLAGSIPASQALADRLIAAGYARMRVRSFAARAGGDDLNLVMWKWDSERPARVVQIDDDDRFSGGLGVIVSELIVGYRYRSTLHHARTGRQHKARVIRYPSCPVGAWCRATV